jgi:hypothetical protein
MSLRSFLRFGPALVLVALAAGCADRTAILVEVTSTDLTIPTDIDAITIRAISAFGASFEQTYPVSTAWPHSLTITPPPSEGIGGVRIDVTGSRGGAFVVRRVIGAEFVPGETRRVQVVLTASCVDVMCADGYDCAGGRCCLGAMCVDGDAGVDGGALDAGPSDAGAEDAGVDAAAVDAGFDAAALDAGFDGGFDAPGSTETDAPRPLDAPLDAGLDAGRDAPLDTPLDAPADAGRDAPLPPGARLVINEIDYDQPGTDLAEYIEIYNAGSVSAALDGIAVLLVNGSSNTEYSRATLSGTLAPGEYVVIGVTGQALTLPVGVARFDVPMMTGGGIQNGAPDGVALVDTVSMTVLDRFSYEGSITTASIFGRSENLVEGTAFTTADSDSTPRSLCRRPNGSDTDVAITDWTTCTPSPGAAN